LKHVEFEVFTNQFTVAERHA